MSACLLAAALLGSTAAPATPATGANVVAYPSSQTISGNALPAGGARSIALAAGRGEAEGAWIVARGGGPVEAAIDTGTLGSIRMELAWGHFVSVGRGSAPDALIPWTGDARASERLQQPVYVRVIVPRTAPPGSYRATVTITAGGATTPVPIAITVFPFTLPAAGERTLLTSFHISPTTYLNTAARLYGLGRAAERRAANAALFRLLADYGISPSSWGFGEPRTPSGYGDHAKWWLDSAANMRDAAGAGTFQAMRIPISSNRTSPARWIAGLSPSQPEQWCDYLRAVRAFWEENGWLARSVPLLYAQDEPTLDGQRLVARQSRTLHACWPGARSLMTGNPSPGGANGFLYDGKGGDDLDVWVILSRRFYGQFTVPKHQGSRQSRSRELATTIARVRKRASVWSYTYGTVAGTPGFRADERLSNARMFLLWNALEGTDGVLYGQGTTSYTGGNPLERISRRGEFVLLYPGRAAPIPSARLEQIRDGIEDWALFDAVRRKEGTARVRSILGRAGLFSADAGGVKLACRLGCALRSSTKYSWPRWSHDASTAARIETARVEALRAVR